MSRRLLLLSLLACAGATHAAPLVGRLEGDTYISPTGEFRVRAPVLPEIAGAIEDSDNVVTFHDDFGTHVSIACFDMDATQRWEFETRDRRDYLLYFFTEVVLANFQARYPGSAIESARYIQALQEGALIAYALVPGGSHFEPPPSITGGPVVDPIIAKRGNLLFVRHRHVYVVSLELAERSTQRSNYPLTTAQEDDLLATRLTALVARMSFTDDRPRQP